jgi:hypothetical protein
MPQFEIPMPTGKMMPVGRLAKVHEYVAVRMALPLMVIVAVFQSYRGEGKSLSVTRMTIYFGFIICLAVVFTPTLDDPARLFAGAICVPLLWTIVYHAYVELINTYPKMPNFKE